MLNFHAIVATFLWSVCAAQFNPIIICSILAAYQTIHGVSLPEMLLIINKSGAWYSYGDERLGQGKENVKEALKNNKKMAQEIEEKIRAITVSKPTGEEGSAVNAEASSETIN